MRNAVTKFCLKNWKKSRPFGNPSCFAFLTFLPFTHNCILIYSGNVGIGGTSSTIFYVQGTEKDRDPNAGGGNPEEGECIEVVFWPIHDIDKLLLLTEAGSPVSTPTVLSSLWFKLNILPKLK